jgi:hypothetical protein
MHNALALFVFYAAFKDETDTLVVNRRDISISASAGAMSSGTC